MYESIATLIGLAQSEGITNALLLLNLALTAEVRMNLLSLDAVENVQRWSYKAYISGLLGGLKGRSKEESPA